MPSRLRLVSRESAREENRRTALILIAVMIALVLISVATIIVKHHH
jgi:hypothetical protein